MTIGTHYDALDLIEQVINQAFQPRSKAPATSPVTRQETRLIRMDVSETEQAYLILAELPGVSKDQLEVVIEGKEVLLQAENRRPEALENTPSRNLMEERFFGKLRRRIQLPQEIDDQAAQARFTDGLLHLQLPKKKAGGIRKLEIQ